MLQNLDSKKLFPACGKEEASAVVPVILIRFYSFIETPFFFTFQFDYRE